MMMGSSKIGTEHLLLALLNDENILSSRILYSLQVDTRRLRQLLLRQLGMTDRQRQHLAKQANEAKKTFQDRNIRWISTGYDGDRAK